MNRTKESIFPVDSVSKEPMGPCQNLPKCPLFENIPSPEARHSIQEAYCKKRWDLCRRKQMSDRGEKVSPTMLPNGREIE